MENKEPKRSRWFFWFLALMLLAFALWGSKQYEHSEFARKTAANASSNSVVMNLLYIGLAIAGIIVLLHFMGKFQRRSFGGKSSVKTYKKTTPNKVTFLDVAGVDEVKAELMEVVEFLRDSKKIGRFGGQVPKGVLLVGQPGTGKTLLARAVAGEAGVPFLSIVGSEFVEMFVGVGASRVRELFNKAYKLAPCIIFIDEIDAVAKHRGAGVGQNHNENEQTLNQMLAEMDGFEKNNGVIVMAATNRPDVLDPAILRPGRFDRRVTVNLPDIKGREAILQVHTKDKILAENLDLNVIARDTSGFSGADLKNLCNEAAIIAGRQEKNAIEMIDFESAKDKIKMGNTLSIIILPEVKRIIATHEAGHAFISVKNTSIDPLYKVSIIPRSNGTLGITTFLPEKEQLMMSKREAEEYIEGLLGGRAAEEVLLGSITNGASGDLKQATALAKEMISKWGMDKEMGLAAHSTSGSNPFLGRTLATDDGMSQQMQYRIERRAGKLLAEHYDVAKRLIEGNKDKMEKLINALLEHETLDGKEVEKILED